MHRLRAIVLLVPVALVVAACGGSGSTPSSMPVRYTDSAAPTVPSTVATSAHAAAKGTVAPVPTTSPPATETTAPRGATAPAGTHPPASHSTTARNGVPLPPPGTYAYRITGTSTSAFGTENLGGNSTLTVDQPKGSREHTRQQDKDGTTDETLVAGANGLLLADLHLSQPGFDEDFRPAKPVLLFPASARQGSRWHWSMTSSDGSYMLHAQLVLSDPHASSTTATGQRVLTVVVSSVLHITGSGFDITSHQRDEAGRDALIVREHAVTDGTAYGTKVHSDVTRVLKRYPS